MENNLKQIVQDIYSNYRPMQLIDRQMMGDRKEVALTELIEKHCQELEACEKARVENEFKAWGPLTPLMGRNDIFEIMVQGPEQIYFESHQGVEKLDDTFLSETSFNNFIDRISQETEILVNQRDPFGSGKTQGFRVHLVVPPISSVPTLTLRKQSTKNFSLEDLKLSNFFSGEQALWMQYLIDTHQNFLIVGPTGSGKTTFLNSLISLIPKTERCVVIEDTDEIKTTNPLNVKLLSREVCPETLKPVFMEDLLKQSLRMRPDRLVIGEVRGAEAKDLMQALATGHTGSMGTLHAHSGQQALLRLEMLVQMGAPQWSLHSIRQLIQLSLDFIVVLKEDRHNKGINEICRVASHEKFGLLLEDLTDHPAPRC